MSEIVKKMLELMEPTVNNIDEKNEELIVKQGYLETIEKLVNAIGDDDMKIFDYENQDLVESLLVNIGSNVSEYKANEYILKSSISEVVHLPQYDIAKRYLESFDHYIKKLFKECSEEYQRLCDEYQNLELVNKYYLMFRDNEVFVNDMDELQKLFDNFDLKLSEKNRILVYILKENNKTYGFVSNQDDFNDYDEEEIENLISKNRNLLSKEYNELLTIVEEYVDITKKIEDIVNYELINKININNILLAKKIWLLKKIEFNYHNDQYRKCVNALGEFEEVNELFNEVRNIKDKSEVIRIIKKEAEYEG